METSTRLPVIYFNGKYHFIDFKLKQFRAIDNPHDYQGFEHFEEFSSKFHSLSNEELLQEQKTYASLLARLSHCHEENNDEKYYGEICLEIALRTGQGLFKCQACGYIAHQVEMVEMHEATCKKFQTFDILMFVEEKCPDCHGTGEIWMTNEDTRDCPACGGSGTAEPMEAP